MGNNIFILYLGWFFVDAVKGILGAWKNVLKFNLNYWSVPLLLKTLFSHWRRYRYSYGKGFDPGRYLEVFSFNFISRIMGFVMRTFFIFAGLSSEVFIFFTGLFILLFWISLPILLALGFIYGSKLIF